jgi:hypothetical protein
LSHDGILAQATLQFGNGMAGEKYLKNTNVKFKQNSLLLQQQATIFATRPRAHF